MHSINGHLRLRSISMDGNRAALGGGALSQHGGSLRIAGTNMSHNLVPPKANGESLFVQRVYDWDVLDSQYHPYSTSSRLLALPTSKPVRRTLYLLRR